MSLGMRCIKAWIQFFLLHCALGLCSSQPNHCIAGNESACDTGDSTSWLQTHSLSSNARATTLKLRRNRFAKQASTDFTTNYYAAAYVVDVMINGQTLPVQIDTGSSTFGVLAIPITYPNGTSKGCPYFKGVKEHCLVDDKYVIKQTYVTGGWEGYICGVKPGGAPENLTKDMVPTKTSLAGLDAGEAAFVGITSQWESYSNCNHVGIIGMAYKDESQLGVTLWDYILGENGDSVQDVFSIGVCPYDGAPVTHGRGELDTEAGVLTLGGSDRSQYLGELQWTPITHETLYCTKLVKFGLSYPNGTSVHMEVGQNKSLNFHGEVNCSAVVDSGNDQGLMLQEEVAEWLIQFLYRLAEDTCPKVMGRVCNERDILVTRSSCAPGDLFDTYYPDIVIGFANGVELKIPPQRYYNTQNGLGCAEAGYSKVGRALTVHPGPNNNLGQSVLETYYTVFDRKNKQLGFAPLANCK